MSNIHASRTASHVSIGLSEENGMGQVRTGGLDVIEAEGDVVVARTGDVHGHVLERPVEHVSA